MLNTLAYSWCCQDVFVMDEGLINNVISLFILFSSGSCFNLRAVSLYLIFFFLLCIILFCYHTNLPSIMFCPNKKKCFWLLIKFTSCVLSTWGGSGFITIRQALEGWKNYLLFLTLSLFLSHSLYLSFSFSVSFSFSFFPLLSPFILYPSFLLHCIRTSKHSCCISFLANLTAVLPPPFFLCFMNIWIYILIISNNAFCHITLRFFVSLYNLFSFICI